MMSNQKTVATNGLMEAPPYAPCEVPPYGTCETPCYGTSGAPPVYKDCNYNAQGMMNCNYIDLPPAYWSLYPSHNEDSSVCGWSLYPSHSTCDVDTSGCECQDDASPSHRRSLYPSHSTCDVDTSGCECQDNVNPSHRRRHQRIKVGMYLQRHPFLNPSYSYRALSGSIPKHLHLID